MTKDVSLLIKSARKFRGMTQKELAKKSGYTSASIIRWENGMNCPSFFAVSVILEACGFELQLAKLENE